MDQMVLATQTWLNTTYNGVNGYTPFSEEELDGVTGNQTYKRLIQALQIELNTQYNAGISVDGSFGNGTLNAIPATISKNTSVNNITFIIQGSLWCKGYSAGVLDGIFDSAVESAVKKFQTDAGITADGRIRPYILQGIMNTDGYAYRGSEGTNKYYKHLVQLGMNANYGAQIGLTAPNGLWERKSHKNYIKCCQIEWGATPVDGVWGNGTMNKAPTLSKNTTGYTASKRLLQWGLTINGYYPGNMSGNFDTNTYNAVYNFQNFLCLGADGIAGKNTWAALLSSRGNTARSASAFDTSTRLTPTTANALKEAGYTEVGRYLTNTPSGTLDKKMTAEELKIIKSVGLKIFPIFQTYGGSVSYFTKYQGRRDAEAAKDAAQNLGFPSTCTIFFAVDYDALMADIASNIIPYFQAINEVIGGSYKIGVYAPRAVCNRLYENGLTRYSFVADMSNGFTGNIGQTMPRNWAYEQFFETTQAGIGIDKCMASPRATAILVDNFTSYNVPDEPPITQEFTVFENVFNLAWEYLDSLSSPFTGVYANILDANQLTLAYFRSNAYDADHLDLDSNGTIIESIKGLSWRMIAGSRDEALVHDIESTYPTLNPSETSIRDPLTGKYMEITHYAATLGACITATFGLNINFFERDVDAFAGWAGDLLQLGGVLQNTLNFGEYNYFNIDDIIFMIGAPDGGLDHYHLYGSNGEEMAVKNAGFGQIDLYQDVDAYNISRIYNLSSMKIHNAFNDYYNVSQKYKRRFSIFKQELLKEFDTESIYDVVLPFTQRDKNLLSVGFGYAFGEFEKEYAEVLDQGFAQRIELGKDIEESTNP